MYHAPYIFLLYIRLPPISTLFPYTTLFRSQSSGRAGPPTQILRIGKDLCRRPEDLRSEEHTSELQSLTNLVCRLLLEKKKNRMSKTTRTQTSINIVKGTKSIAITTKQTTDK